MEWAKILAFNRILVYLLIFQIYSIPIGRTLRFLIHLHTLTLHLSMAQTRKSKIVYVLAEMVYLNPTHFTRTGYLVNRLE